MTTEENKRMLALSCIVADLKAENMELVEHVKKLVDEYNEVALKLNEKEKRMNEGSSTQTLDELQQMQEQCDKLKTANTYLEQRVQELVDEYNNVAQKLIEKKMSNEEAPSKQTLAEFQQMREQCEHLKRKNEELEHFSKAMHAFVKDKNLYMKKNNECPYHSGDISVCSTYCLECDSCLGVIEGHGVICGQRLKEANVFAGH